MKRNMKRTGFTASMIAIALTGIAQTTYSGYFVENYDYRFQMNPALGNEKGFVSFPVLGNLNINMHGNLHVNDIFYVRDGKTVLFTNPKIGEKEAMKKFGDKNRIGTSEKIDILTVGFNAFGGYNAVSLGVVANADISVPGAFFSLAKEGLTNKTYDIENLFGNVNAYAQIALNHSRDIKQVPGLRVGGSLKFLIGAGNLDFRFNEAKLTLGEQNWTAMTNAQIYASVGGFKYKYDRNDHTGKDYVSGGEIDSFKPQGFGMALDLGATYKWRDFTFSAAVLDLGFVNWGKTQKATTKGTQKISTDSYIFNADDDADNSFSKEWHKFTDDLAGLYQMTEVDELSSYTRALGATLNFAGEYELPYYRKLHFGVLNSTKINGKYTWTQFRFSANVQPIKCISADVNMVAGTYGVGFGWLFNLHCPGFNLFLGMDHTLGKLAKQGIPLNSNASVNFGINFPFAK